MAKALEISNLTKKYGKLKALDDLTLTLDEGRILGYLGPNGAGKTTTIKILLGLIKPYAGSVSVFGIDAQKDKSDAHKLLAYVPSEPAFWPNLTGKETLYMLSELHGNYSAEQQSKLMKLFDFDPNKKVRDYSRGNRQKISLIYAFSTGAKFLVMDEPSSGLDPLMEQVFRQSVIDAKKKGQTIFLSSHLLEEVESLCDDIAILKAGKLVESGTLAELKHLASIRVEAIFANKPPEISHIKGVNGIKISGHKLNCQVNGPVDDLFKELLKSSPTQLYSRPASLEDLFLSVYGPEK